MQQGQEVGALARGETAAEITAALLAETGTQVLFEATAKSGPFIAKADILQRHGSGWHVLEVKSSFADTGKLKDLLDDIAYTVMVFRRAGVLISKASLLLLSRSFRFGDGPDRLFEMVEVNVRFYLLPPHRRRHWYPPAGTVLNSPANV